MFGSDEGRICLGCWGLCFGSDEGDTVDSVLVVVVFYCQGMSCLFLGMIYNICAKFPICKMFSTRSPSSQSCVIILQFLSGDSRHKSIFQTF